MGGRSFFNLEFYFIFFFTLAMPSKHALQFLPPQKKKKIQKTVHVNLPPPLLVILIVIKIKIMEKKQKRGRRMGERKRKITNVLLPLPHTPPGEIISIIKNLILRSKIKILFFFELKEGDREGK
mgnify:CR=1 FL=1